MRVVAFRTELNGVKDDPVLPHPLTLIGVSFKLSSSYLFGRQTRLTVLDRVTGLTSFKSAKSNISLQFFPASIAA